MPYSNNNIKKATTEMAIDSITDKAASVVQLKLLNLSTIAHRRL